MSRAPWADLVMEEIFDGVQEWEDPEENPRILDYFAVGCPGFDPVDGDETNWCAALIWWALVRAGMEVPKQRMPTARSLQELPPAYKGRPGDVIVLWRESPHSWKGHVGIFLERLGNYVVVAGGNQGNRVSVATFYEARVLGFYRPRRPLEV